MPFYEFHQNNSGGSFEVDDAHGIGPRVWIEGASVADAITRAETIGIYFDGCAIGRDCPCCGDRWYKPWRDDGSLQPEIDSEYDFNWHPTVYVHRRDGEIERHVKVE